ncbi:methyltransferase domain-containing protein [Candidatus Peregrinibacteria bacterium]|nr:methyltransferase domain-containing protein [Candidatus Peregrinibacteria bacterium]
MMNKYETIKNWEDHWDRMGNNKSSLNQVNRDNESSISDANYIKKILKINKTDLIADFCCGNGLITSKTAFNCKNITGIDFSKNLIKSAIDKTKKQKNCKFIVGDITRTNLPSHKFDKIYCLTSFHYFPDMKYVKKVLEEMLRISKPQGKILITDIPNKNTLGYKIWKLIRNPDPDKIPAMEELRPSESFYKRIVQRVKLLFRRFTNKKVESDNWTWFTQSGFKNLKLDNVDKIEILPSFTPKKILNYRFNVLITTK